MRVEASVVPFSKTINVANSLRHTKIENVTNLERRMSNNLNMQSKLISNAKTRIQVQSYKDCETGFTTNANSLAIVLIIKKVNVCSFHTGKIFME